MFRTTISSFSFRVSSIFSRAIGFSTKSTTRNDMMDDEAYFGQHEQALLD